jgi:hypothetical protein
LRVSAGGGRVQMGIKTNEERRVLEGRAEKEFKKDSI